MEAQKAVEDGFNVLVCAPTGSGKTVVGEMAVTAALGSGGRAFYTAPIKALSNQKYNDLRAVLGDESVGLLTGDHSLNGDAPVVVMTTEVLRNMVYSHSAALEGLRWVVLDEVHFLSDAYRGPVWEEVLIHTPAPVRFACLSATVSNSDQLGDWIEGLRGPTTTVVEHERPVELTSVMLVGDRHADRDHLVPLLVDGAPNPRGQRFDADRSAGRGSGGPAAKGAEGGGRRRFRTPRRLEVLDRLGAEDLLPAIYFIFSRAGCSEAASGALDSGIRLTTAEEAARVREILERHVDPLADEDLSVLEYPRFAEALERGIASHHAGMVPAFREAVEECFVEGLVKVVFATETLALGINMPARSVVIERLTKFTGDGHDTLTPGQFTQLTGRAGRRGIDEHGTAVVLWSPFIDFASVARLAASREFPLTSVFRPTYNMAVNLLDNYDPREARSVLSRSFAQFQADSAFAGERRRLEQRRRESASAEQALEAMPGVAVDEALEFVALARQEQRLRSERDRGRSAVEASLANLRPGDVLERDTPSGNKLVVVVSVAERRRSVRVDAVTPRAKPVRIDSREEAKPVQPCGTVQLPVPYAPKDGEFRSEAAARLRRVNTKRLRRPRRTTTDESMARWQAAREAFDAHDLADHDRREEILATARELAKARHDIEVTERRLDRKGADLSKRFEAVTGVLREVGHLEGTDLTAQGRRLRRIYHESDLLVSLVIEAGILEGMDAAELAAMVSCVTHEHRGSDPPPPPRLPTALVREGFEEMRRIHRHLTGLEVAAGLPPTREPSAGFAVPAHTWTSGAGLEVSLDENLSGGDFVRNAKQLIDVLRQVADVTRGPTSAAAREACDLLRRDVVDTGVGPA